MLNYTTCACPHCGKPIGNRLFIRDRLDAAPEHFHCYRRARREAARTRAVLPERRPDERPMFVIPARRVAGNESEASQNDADVAGGLALHTEASEFFRDRFLIELAYYEADQVYLTVEKRAERCRKLSVLLTLSVACASPFTDLPFRCSL